MTALSIVVSLIDFYQILIVVYVLMSWLRPSTGLVYDIYRTLGTIVEPWLGLFRKIVPTMGMLDVSPIVAIVALSMVQWLVRSLMYALLG
ncbi:MAG: YggT family protein [Actinobacteria bacterium]|nr:YggT family protein [Actinomycetota bacterium]